MAEDAPELAPSRSWEELIATSRRRGTSLRRRRRMLTAAPVVAAVLAVSGAATTLGSGPDRDVLDVATEPSPSPEARLPVVPTGGPTQAPAPQALPQGVPQAAQVPARPALPPLPVERPVPGPDDRRELPGSRTPVTSGPGGDGLRRLVFSRGTQYEPNQRNFEVLTALEDGSGERQLTTSLTHDEYDTAWSPDGGRIAFAKDEWSGVYGDQVVGGIFVMGHDGSDARRLTKVACAERPDPCFDEEPSWSPDGGTIAFHRYGSTLRDCAASATCPEIWTVRSDGSGARRLTSGWEASFSPDGRRLVFADASSPGDHTACRTAADVPEQCQGYLYISNADGTGRRALGVAGASPQWSPDGTRVVFQAGEMHRYDIAVLDLATAEVTRVTADANSETAPAWSPDGRDIAYVKGGDIYIVYADGERERVTSTPEAEEGVGFAPS